jgi:uncharacterized protein YcgL (UPF0745 family)
VSRRLVSIYRSAKVAEMYLYVDRAVGLAPVPPPLLERFGVPELVTTLLLEPTRPLARATAADVLAKLDAQGFFLQLPPPPIPRGESGVRADHVPHAPSERTPRRRDE